MLFRHKKVHAFYYKVFLTYPDRHGDYLLYIFYLQ